MKLNYTKMFLINYVYLLMLELVFKTLVINTFDIGIFYIMVFTLPIAILLTFITSLFKRNGVNRIISIIMWILVYAIFVAETVYYSFYKTICGLSALMYGGQVMEFASSIMVHVKANLGIILGMLVPLIILILLSVVKVIKHDKYVRKDTWALLIATFFFAISTLEIPNTSPDSPKNLYFNKNDLMQTTNTLGVTNAVLLDAVKLVVGFEENIEIVVKREFTKEENVEYNVTDIDFDTLMANESDNTINSMHAYFTAVEPTNKNEYTGMFAGKNLIFIVAEAFYPIAVDAELTPTLYKLVNNGFVFDNFYQPIYNCSTSDGEFINQLSILPGVATCSMKETIGVDLPYSLGNIMDNYGYSTYGFHGWTYNYYNRDKTMPNLGYNYYGYDRYKRGYKNALQGIKDSWPTSDIDVMNASYPIYASDKRFVAYYMTISGHLEYNFGGGNAIASKNKSLVNHLDANSSIKAYMATQIEFDKSLEILLSNLERDGILDDTVIVISSDHYPYGLSENDISSYVDWMNNANFDLYKNNLVIYNSELETKHVSKYTSSLDLLPTLLNLFGVEYDSRLLMGTDIFSSSEDLVIFNNKSWITSKGRYDYMKKVFEPFIEEIVSDEYIEKINRIVDLKFQTSKLIISKNYYQKLGGL